MIIVLDFGSQTTHLIKRRLEELDVPALILPGDSPISQILPLKPKGLILSGGPKSVYQKNVPHPDKKIWPANIPILGICYGLQIIAYHLGGQVNPGKKPEFGPAILKISKTSPLFKNLPKNLPVWMSHGDEVILPPKGFTILGKTSTLKIAAFENKKRKIFGVQFHPEVEHTKDEMQILKNFARICQVDLKQNSLNVQTLIEMAKAELNQDKAICAVSGGVDSTVAAKLVRTAIGKNLIPVYIENGLMSAETRQEIKKEFPDCIVVRAEKLFLHALSNVVSPEQKRKIIGRLYIKLFEREAKKHHAHYLIQGTIYSDVIESGAPTSHSSKIKSHHNVGGLPKKMKLQLYEPLRPFYKDQVREIGKKLGISPALLNKHPYPGPGNAIRIIGKITQKRLNQQQKIHAILISVLKKHNLLNKVFQAFPVLTGIKSTAVKGDARFYGEVVALRIYTSTDIMTADFARIPYPVLGECATRILNEVKEISRVVYDITTKPPATMEWE